MARNTTAQQRWRRIGLPVAWSVLALVLALFLVSCLSGKPMVAPTVRQYPAAATAKIAGPPVVPAGNGTLRLLTLNLAHGRKDGFSQILQSGDTIRGHLGDVADVLRRESPDLVALQEADGPSVWSGNVNHVGILAESAGFGYSIQGAHVAGAGLSYGTAILSRRAIEAPVSVTFGPSIPPFPKGFVVGRIRWPGLPGGGVDVVSVHLDFARPSVRRAQVEEMVRRLSSRPGPRIILGDFNSEWADEDSAVRALAKALNLNAWRETADGLDTFPFSERRLDWILISPELEFRDYRVLPDVLSDHLGVLATIAPKTAPPTRTLAAGETARTAGWAPVAP